MERFCLSSEFMSKALSYYEILRISSQSSSAEIKKAFRRLARQVHPDLHPNDAEAAAQFKLISQAYEVLGDAERRSQYDTLLNESPSDKAPVEPQSYPSCYRQAIHKLSQRDYRGAIVDFTQAIAIFPGGTEAYLGRAKAYDALKNDKAVLEDCYQILQRDPNAAQAYVYQGQARLRLGYPQGAVEAYTKAIALDTTFAQAYYRRAQARLELKETALAYPDLQKAIELFRAQQNGTQAQQVEQLLKTLRPPAAAAMRLPQTGVAQFLKLAFSNLLGMVLNPSGNLLPVFARLTTAQAGWAGLLYGFIAVGCWIFGNWMTKTDQFLLLPSVLTGLAAYLSVAIALTLTRLVAARGSGSYSGDLFVSGVASLPIAVLMLGGSFVTPLGSSILFVLGNIAGCYSILILYIGCTQLSHIDEARAMVAVPFIVLMGRWALSFL
jgi:tetratricopeptide (TPR) repeat protein